VKRYVNLPTITSVTELVAIACALGAREVKGWSAEEEAIAHSIPIPSAAVVTGVKQAICEGHDFLGEWFCQLHSPEQRRPMGAIYTPKAIVDAMVRWASSELQPARIVDPGAGSARFLVAAGRQFTEAVLLGIELDPLAAILARGHLAAANLAGRSSVTVRDYRDNALAPVKGRTLFLGNPPYVRHHLLGPRWKAWLVATARRHGLEASQLAGLHAHFFLATAEYARPGDVGVLVTAAEWLDVNYGRLVRELLLGELGAKNIQVIEPTASPFPGTATTGVITGFEAGARPAAVGLRRVGSLDELNALEPAYEIKRECFEAASRWTPLTRTIPERRDGFVELGELCRVHRGQVTGANRVWIADVHAQDLPTSVLFPAVTRAREIFAVDHFLENDASLRRVIDLPIDLDIFEPQERQSINRFLQWAQSVGADGGFVARYRKAWWAVGLRIPAPILATYMARRPPRFVRNLADARHINIAHGLYPREVLSEEALRKLATYLSRSTSLNDGRTYAGGLTKFEPREMERLLIPRPELLTGAITVEELL